MSSQLTINYYRTALLALIEKAIREDTAYNLKLRTLLTDDNTAHVEAVDQDTGQSIYFAIRVSREYS